MDIQTFKAMIRQINAPKKNQETKIIMDMLSTPQAISMLFQLIENPSDSAIKKTCLVMLPRCLLLNESHIDQNQMEQIYNKLFELITNEQNVSDLNMLLPTACDFFKKDKEKCMKLLGILDNFFQAQKNVMTVIKIVDAILDVYDDQFISANLNTFLNYSLVGLRSDNFELSVPALKLFFNALSTADSVPDSVAEHIQLILKMTETINPSNQDVFIKFWGILGDVINCDLLPINIVGILFDIALKIASDPNVSAYCKLAPLNSLVGIVNMLDASYLSRILDSVFMLSVEHVSVEETMPVEFFDLVVKALQEHPAKEVYELLKARVLQFLALDNKSAHVVAVSVFATVFQVAPEAAFADSQFIIQCLMDALNKNDDILNTAVCTVLDSFSDSFNAVDVFTLPFIPKIIPFIISTNDDLRQTANNALHTLCELLNVPMPGFFNALWAIKDQVPQNELCNFLPFLAESIEKSEDFGDNECETLKNFIIPCLNSPDLDMASNFLIIASTLMKINDTLVDHLMPLSLNVILNIFSNMSEYIEDSTVNSLDFVSNIFEIFGEKVKELFVSVIQMIRSELLFDESPRISSAALDACCTVAESTGDAALAADLQEKCCSCFSIDTEIELDEDDEENEAVNYTLYTNAADSCSKIAKLLNQDDAKQLFLNLFEIVIDIKDPRIAADILKPITRLLHCASDGNRDFFIKKCQELLNLIIKGKFKALDGKDVFSGNIDMFLMTNIAYLIADIVRYPGPIVDELCAFMLKVIEISGNTTLYSFIGAYSDVIKYGTGSEQSVNAILALLPQLFELAADPDTRQNLAFMLLIIVKKNPASLQNIMPFIDVLQNWYLQGTASPNGHQIMLSNIASAFLTFMASGMPINQTLLNEAILEFPPYDRLETPAMIQNMATIFTNSGANIDANTVLNAATSLSKLFLLNEIDIRKKKITPELYNVAKQMFVTFSKSNPQIIQAVLDKYKNSRSKLAKLNAVLQ